MKAVALTILGLFLLVSLASANHPQDPQENGTMVAFDHVGGNEWWVEVKVTGDQPFDAVGARDEGGPWVGLVENAWGVWAGSFHIEPGHKVQFQAVDTPHAGEKTTSCWFTHPGGVEQCDAEGEPTLSVFDHKGSNEWWVQVGVSGTPQRVQAQDTGGSWNELQFKDWGDWAASFHIQPGHDVRFRAMVDSTWHESCWFTHPAGKAPDGSETCGTSGDEPPPPPPPSGDFDATFQTSGGNQWWVEVYVDANEPLAGVDARANDGMWHQLTLRSWGAWAKSFHVPDGSVVEFRAHSTDGDIVVSGGYLWPEGTRLTPEPDPEPGDDIITKGAFGPKASNQWWVETMVVADGNLSGVEARADGGDWHGLTLRDWHSWAGSFHVPDGSIVEFRAHGRDGGTISSDGFVWPLADPASGNLDWPRDGSYVHSRYYDTVGSEPNSELEVVFVYDEGVGWYRQCTGFENFDQPVFEFGNAWPPDGAKAGVGDTVSVYVLVRCDSQNVDEITVTERHQRDMHQNGDPVTVWALHGERIHECLCIRHHVEWDDGPAWLTFFYHAGVTATRTSGIIDTNGPID